ncbi:MAG: cysteine--tRNA ligase [Gemmatimonadetes bacterium]|nr:cysteine--tRNA ligase [Gemmatimonadota bacterium]
MTLKLYNTLTRSLDPFEPLEEGSARVYACGPTIYDYAHIGNFRAFVVYDLLHRYLEWSGYEVRFVMNLTDVDDKTIEGAAERGTTLREYTGPFAEAFLEDSRTLGILPVDAYPRATDHVDAMVGFVERLLDREMAYVTDDGSVYFSIAAFPDYGKLSRVDLDQVKPGARVAVDEYAKDDVRDFALWKAVKPQDEEVGAAWDAPWGRGRPGWHLECSVMSVTELGETLDIHMGGEDLVFPHHEDEIAQSEGATGKPFVRNWLHVKHLLVEGRKMSKSAGNFIRVRGLLDEGYEAAAIRHQLLSAQYRHDLNFTREGLEGSSRALQRLLDFEGRLEALLVSPDGEATPLAGQVVRVEAVVTSLFERGDVLVTRSTTPAFNAVLPLVGAIVTDRGGLLSHAAIIAREYGIPAVVGTAEATMAIPDGARVMVDGTAGRTTVLG